MTDDPVLDLLARLLGRIAPEISRDELRPEVALHDLGDLDSMDFLNLMTALYDETGIDVPERDYPEVSTVGGFVAYVSTRTPSASEAPTAPVAARH